MARNSASPTFSANRLFVLRRAKNEAVEGQGGDKYRAASRHGDEVSAEWGLFLCSPTNSLVDLATRRFKAPPKYPSRRPKSIHIRFRSFVYYFAISNRKRKKRRKEREGRKIRQKREYSRPEIYFSIPTAKYYGGSLTRTISQSRIVTYSE